MIVLTPDEQAYLDARESPCHCQFCDPAAFRAMLHSDRGAFTIGALTDGPCWHVSLDGECRDRDTFAAQGGESGWVASHPRGHRGSNHIHVCARCEAEGRDPSPCMAIEFGRVEIVEYTDAEKGTWFHRRKGDTRG